MKNIFNLFLLLFLSLGLYAEEAVSDDKPESEYEDGCSNELDDDMDGNVDADDEDCAALLLQDDDSGIMGGLASSDVSSYLVWGVGIALLSSVDGSSGTGTATTD